MRESETKDLRDVDHCHLTVTLDAQNARHRGEITLYAAGRPVLYAPLGPAVWDVVFHDPNLWHPRDELMRLIAEFELGVLGLVLAGDPSKETFQQPQGGGPLLFSSAVEHAWR